MEYGPRTTLEILQENQKNLDDRQINSELLKGRIIFMSTFNDIDWTKEIQSVRGIPNKSGTTQNGFSVDTVILGPRDEDKWYGTHTCKPEGKWNTIAENMVEDFKETGHPVFRGISALNRGTEKKRFKMYKKFTSLRNLRIQSCCFARFTLQTR